MVTPERQYATQFWHIKVTRVAISSPTPLTLFKLEQEERTMRLSGNSVGKRSGSEGGFVPLTLTIDGLANQSIQASVNASGGGHPFYPHSGPFKDWDFGGEKRKHVYGNT